MHLGIGVAVKNPSTYTGQKNWGSPQPIACESTDEYLELAYARRTKFAEIIERIAKNAGPGVSCIPPSIKSPESADRKLWDRTSSFYGQPERINDYLRARIYVPARPGNLGQLTHVINEVIDHPQTVAFKDCHWRPKAQTAWRDTKAIINVDGLNAEFQVIAGNNLIQMGNDITEGLREKERGVRSVGERFRKTESMTREDVQVFRKLLGNAENSLNEMRKLRTAVHDFAFAASGLNPLMDPDVQHKHAPVEGQELVRMFKHAGKQRLCKPVYPLLGAVQQLISLKPGQFAFAR